MNLHTPSSVRRSHGFTMIEITICLTVIVIGLVAVLGVLPAGIEASKKNREQALMTIEGNYILEAIRNGATNFTGGRYVDLISTNDFKSPDIDWEAPRDTNFVVGFLSTPGRTVRAQVRTASGIAAEKGEAIKDSVFQYLLTAEVMPFQSFYYDTNPASDSYQNAAQVQTNLWEIRITLDWPVLPGPDKLRVGSNRKIFRALTSSKLVKRTVKLGGADADYWLFEPTTYIRAGEQP